MSYPLLFALLLVVGLALLVRRFWPAGAAAGGIPNPWAWTMVVGGLTGFVLLFFDIGRGHLFPAGVIVVSLLVIYGLKIALPHIFPGHGGWKSVYWLGAVPIATIAIVGSILVWVVIPYARENPMLATSWLVSLYDYATATPDDDCDTDSTDRKEICIPVGGKKSVTLDKRKWEVGLIKDPGCYALAATKKYLVCYEGQAVGAKVHWPFGGAMPSPTLPSEVTLSHKDGNLQVANMSDKPLVFYAKAK